MESAAVATKIESVERDAPSCMIGSGKKKETMKDLMEKLIEAGLFTKVKRGRKRLYTPEEAMEVKKRQIKEGKARRQARILEAKTRYEEVIQAQSHHTSQLA